MRHKRDFRLHTRNEFERLSHRVIQTKSHLVYRQLFNWSMWKNASTVALTMAAKNEIDTKPIIEKGWEENKSIAVPKVIPNERALDFYNITSFDQTKVDFAGIFEPDPLLTTHVKKNHFDLIIVPGLAFDKQKFRIGFGGGYYDRFLEGLKITTCSLVLDFQLHDHIPREEHDIPLTALVTETGIIS
ncbi:5-formyltetrahydrofolate cyclo-ligase [Alteribacillus sp. JSM 102045]|uniref:5-formyltetrahydrofolate cyclo-ligase n=1 Tax=Alteribacillus sp. JSM 102045 TaxID=1562101 RepID=UPI0035BF1A8C